MSPIRPFVTGLILGMIALVGVLFVVPGSPPAAGKVEKVEYAPEEFGEKVCGGSTAGVPRCPSPPAGFQLKNPGIPSLARCRGACGPDCNPLDCAPGDNVCLRATACRVPNPASHVLCVENADRTQHRRCTYAVTECGSHPACVRHDQCFDNCVAFRPPAEVAECQNGCNVECVENWGAVSCAQWAIGQGDQPNTLRYTDPPIEGAVQNGPCS